MRNIKGKELLIVICVSYAVINISISVLEAIFYRKASLCSNNIMMLAWTSIAVFILSIHSIFDRLSPLVMILVQYIMALSLVMLTTVIVSIFSPVSKGGYYDIFMSFTIPYIIGAVIYYIEVFTSVHKQNKLLDEIHKSHNK